MADIEDAPIPEETPPEPPVDVEEPKPWIRGLWMLIVAIMIRITAFLMCLLALLQYGFYVFGKGPNKNIADLGEKLGDWLSSAARYQTGVTEARPWPWSEEA